MIENGADVKAKDWIGFTPLHYAIELGRADVVELLIEKGANTDVKSASGLTPLHLATQRSRARITKLLLESGANPHEADDKGRAKHQPMPPKAVEPG